MEMLKGKGGTIVEHAPRSVQSDMPVQYRWKKVRDENLWFQVSA